MSNEKRSTPVRTGKQVRWKSLLMLGAAVSGGGLLMLRGEGGKVHAEARPGLHGEAKEARLPEVTTRVVTAGSLDRALRVTGTLKSNEVVKVSTKATGLIRRILVEEGDRVRAGQLLVQIDDRELQAQRSRALAAVSAAQANVTAAEANLRAAEAKFSQAGSTRTVKDAGAEAQYRQAEQALATAQSRLAQAQANAGIEATHSETRVASAASALKSAKERLKALQEGARRQETAQAQASVAQAQAQADKLKSMLGRREQLLRDGAISEEEVDNARRDHEVAVASLNVAKQQLDLVREGPRSEELRMQEETVRQAEAALRDAEANRARRGISNQDVQAAEAQVLQAQAALGGAKAGLGQREISSEEIRGARAAVAQAKAAVAQTRAAVLQAQAEVQSVAAQLAQTRVLSPVDAVVSTRQAHVGESLTAANNELMTLVASDSVYLEATAPETALPYLQEGAHVAVDLDAVPGRTFTGTLREIIPVSADNTRSVRLRIAVAGARTGVVGGFARAVLQGGSAAPVVSVPRSALVSEQGQSAVFVFANGKVQRRPVQPGLRSGSSVEIRHGLRTGEQIVTADADRLTDGQDVTQRP